jgi:phage recombination protein Bet
MSEIQVANPAPMQKFDQTQIDLIKTTIMPGASNQEIKLFEQICRRTQLDPFARQIYAVSRKAKENGQWVEKWSYQTSVDGFRLIAERSGKYEGQTPTMWCDDTGTWSDVWVQDNFPKAAKVGVYKTGHREPTWAVARWDSYVQMTRDNYPTKMWAKMPDLMLAKCAECLALRKAFPQELSGLYAAEEMAQSENVAQEVTPNEKPARRSPREAPPLPASTPRTLSQQQLKRMFAIGKTNGWGAEQMKEAMIELTGVENSIDLSREQYDFICEHFEKNEPTQDAVGDFMAQPEPSFDEPLPNHAPGAQ